MPDQMQFVAAVPVYLYVKDFSIYTERRQSPDDGRSFRDITLRCYGKEFGLTYTPSRGHDSLKGEKE